jgi:hypothetical protein
VDGANAARRFLAAHHVDEEKVQAVWEAIALHTTPGVTQYMRPEVALLHSGVVLDVLGRGFEQFPSGIRDEIVARYPRRNFKEGMVRALFGSFARKPASTYGTVNACVCERFIPGYKSPNACDRRIPLPRFRRAGVRKRENVPAFRGARRSARTARSMKVRRTTSSTR